jgi:LEA14-like dessication related protein
MNCARQYKTMALVLVLSGLAACASLPENMIASPDVELRDVQVMGLGFNNQTFLLSFDIRNPNPFPLPVRHVRYGVRLDGQRFASGETESSFSVPAGGEKEFAISVELDLLKTAPQLVTIIRAGTRRDIPYTLQGELGVDIPMAPPVSYRTNGSIRLAASGF